MSYSLCPSREADWELVWNRSGWQRPNSDLRLDLLATVLFVVWREANCDFRAWFLFLSLENIFALRTHIRFIIWSYQFHVLMVIPPCYLEYYFSMHSQLQSLDQSFTKVGMAPGEGEVYFPESQLDSSKHFITPFLFCILRKALETWEGKVSVSSNSAAQFCHYLPARHIS